MNAYLILIPPDTKNKEALLWLFRTAIMALNLKKVRVDEKEISAYQTLRLNQGFQSEMPEITLTVDYFNKRAFSFNNEGIITGKYGDDELLTAFYLINCLQEYNSVSLDPIGRFKFEDSYQKRFNKIESNFVTLLFEGYFRKHLSELLENRVEEKSSFFLSHDIDSLYGAFLQDGKAALKKGRLDIIARLIVNAVILRPDWFNIDKIISIESEYDLRSTFFWIVNKGRVNSALTNADYDINSKKVKDTLASIMGKGNSIGLHKSISSETFNQEILKLNKHIVLNRNHYLRFQLPQHFNDLEKSEIKIDCSLGFAEHYGFRNSLAIPFVPFNLEAAKPFSFLEIPLNVMDGTFQKYMSIPPGETSRRIIDFIEKNKYNSVISVLWHNHFFSSYRFKGYFEPYEDLLFYIKEKKFSVITPGQLFNKYYHLK